MDVVRHVDDGERRARLVQRQLLGNGRTAATTVDVVGTADALTALHATDHATIYLSLWARVPDVTVADIDDALVTTRSLVKQMAMRRTIFALSRPLLPAAAACARARLSAPHRRRLATEIERSGIADDGDAWITAATDVVLTELAGGSLRTTPQLADVPQLAGRLGYGDGKSWNGSTPVASLLLTQLWIDGLVTRANNDGRWWLNKPLWTATDSWLGAAHEHLDVDAAFAALVRHWLRTFGPGTVDDIVWWLGATKGIVRAALTAVGAVAVSLDQPVAATGVTPAKPTADNAVGWLLPDDVDPLTTDRDGLSDLAAGAALLPTLDPTTMGWKHRRFYLGEQQPLLFDTAGNGGATAWWQGAVVGTWVQDADGRVHVVPTVRLSRSARAALAGEAERLGQWLDGQRVSATYTSPAMIGARDSLR